MNTINIHNYEAYLLDYLENNLSDNQQIELLVFLEEHPELNIELNDLSNNPLVCDDSIVFENKNKLKQIAIESLMIAEMEGVSSENDSKELKELLALQPILQKDFDLYKKTVLIPSKIVFLDKESLRKEKPARLIYWWMSSAAALILALFILKIFSTSEINDTEQLVEVVVEDSILNQTTEILPSNSDYENNQTTEVASTTLTNEKKEKRQINLQEKKSFVVAEELPLEEMLLINETAIIDTNNREFIIIEPYLEEDNLANFISIEPIDEATLNEINQFNTKKNETSLFWVLAEKITQERVTLAKQTDEKGKLQVLQIGDFSYARK
ncbi:MAG: hypothetical protein CO022_00670 [Flavobacteriales bacterium CG_4_9_14_0_2_um_filter_32_27]|nr:MAG: hypothetical protein CO022_00670 [Flavobacteriales bacterium CG_4_9_14_0_2_um_filter_32_27]